jgi:diguanylate cyclase (GGDEF)-like protein
MPTLPSAGPDADGSDALLAGGYAPYGQLVKMLLPSAGSIAIYDANDEVVWCSDGYERPDLRGLLESLRHAGGDTLAGRGSVKSTAAGVPAFVAGLRGEGGRPLGSLVLELAYGQNARYSGSMVASLLRPVLDCLESRLNLERTIASTERDDGDGLDLLLTVDEDGREDATALEQLLRHCVEHLRCVLGALLVPDKNLTILASPDPAAYGLNLLDRTQKHLLAWAQLNNRPMVVNRVSGTADAAPYKILSCPVRDPYNRVTGLLALFRAASAEDFQLKDVRILEFVSRKAVAILGSQYDQLTGLPNRLIFERRMHSCLDHARDTSSALLYVDIDKLQAVNEAFGFQAGDEVIQRVADVIKRSLGEHDEASRIAGDRFAIFAPRRTAPQGAELAKRILASAAQLGYSNGAQSLPVTVSIGVAGVEGSARPAHLLACAELACKRAKRQGRNRFELHTEDNTLMLLRRKELVAATSLQEALKSNDFRLETQPIVGLYRQAGQTIGREVLVRMRSSSGELLAPDKFFEAAERYELMPALDRWVLCSTLDILRSHPGHLPADTCYTINVSEQSLATRKYAAFVLEQLAQTGLAPAAFCFEIKEAAAVNHLEAAAALVTDLVAVGCKVALDDFGCGLSSLAHLNQLPVQYLKIDGRFVRRILDDRVAESIVSGITRAAQTLGVATIAEHVESEGLADKLRGLQVDYGQGFFLGRAESLTRVAGAVSPVPGLRTASQ